MGAEEPRPVREGGYESGLSQSYRTWEARLRSLDTELAMVMHACHPSHLRDWGGRITSSEASLCYIVSKFRAIMCHLARP